MTFHYRYRHRLAMSEARMSLFTLNASSLLFLPTDNFQKCSFTSVYIHTTHTDKEVLALYAQVQQTTSELVTKLAAQHVRLPFPQAVFPLVLEGDGYNLRCTLKPWPYGKTLELKWGEIWLTPSEEKWQVLFETTD
ncbi:hypothetical protein EDB84DRAFT_594842 [Lactarius hengduanensis]|nr:hypothetical protein EDB84DRAFT_594842 [Lactarius hengduanensis]